MLPESIKKIDSYVNDFSDVLSQAEQSNLDTLFVTHEQEKGPQIVTIFFPHRKWLQLKDIAMEVFNTTWIGQKDKNDGLLLVVSTEEEKLRIMVGKWLEWIYDRTWCRELIDQKLRPLLHKWEYAQMVRVLHVEVSKVDLVKERRNLKMPPKPTMVNLAWISFITLFSQIYPFPSTVSTLTWITIISIFILVLAFFANKSKHPISFTSNGVTTTVNEKSMYWFIYKTLFFIIFLLILIFATHYKCTHYAYSCNKVSISNSSWSHVWWNSSIKSNSSSNTYKSSNRSSRSSSSSSRGSSSSSYSGWGWSTNGWGYWD